MESLNNYYLQSKKEIERHELQIQDFQKQKAEIEVDKNDLETQIMIQSRHIQKLEQDLKDKEVEYN